MELNLLILNDEFTWYGVGGVEFLVFFCIQG